MRRKRRRARNKQVLKMTREGLIERDIATGEDTRISKREKPLDLRQRDAAPNAAHGAGRVESKSANKRKQGAYLQLEPTQAAEYQNAAYPYEPQATDAPFLNGNGTGQVADTAEQQSQQPNDAPRNTEYRHGKHTALQHDTAITDTPHTQNKPPGARKQRQEPARTDTTDVMQLESVPPSDTAPDTQWQPVSRTAEQDAPPPSPGERPQTTVENEKHGESQFPQEEKTPPITRTKPNRILSQGKRGAERAADKPETVKDKLPTNRKARSQHVSDEKSGKAKRKLYFEAIPQERHIGGTTPLRPAGSAANAVMLGSHREIYQAEDENVSVKAAHRAEMLTEGSVRSALRFQKNAQYNKVPKLEHKATKKSAKLSYQRALTENPKLKSNVFSRMAQKRKIKKQYAKAALEAKKAVRQRSALDRNVARGAGRGIKALAGVIRRHPVAAATIILLALLLFSMMSLFSVFTSAFSGGLNGILTASYLAEDTDIEKAELSYTEWETDLRFQIANIESNYSGYDEYRYNIGNIGHNPYELLAYLTAMYQSFTYDAIYEQLRALFTEQYTLTLTSSSETRYADPTDINDDGDYEPYGWSILSVTLTSKSLSSVITPLMNDDQLQHYDILMQTKGSRQYLGNPFGGMDWLPYVTSYYGWRVHPISGEKNLHRAVDIGLPTGTEILSGQDGVVTFADYNASYGNVVVIENDKGLVSKYAHCDTLLVSVGQTVRMGDVIATVGSTGNSTGPHLHLEVMKNGAYLNPLLFTYNGT